MGRHAEGPVARHARDAASRIRSDVFATTKSALKGYDRWIEAGTDSLPARHPAALRARFESLAHPADPFDPGREAKLLALETDVEDRSGNDVAGGEHVVAHSLSRRRRGTIEKFIRHNVQIAVENRLSGYQNFHIPCLISTGRQTA